ncbi:MAG: hypothetical protein HY360_10975 [Verrucomicrobia bacterium]|nr:hypothetical protein [Verrucomicrobiota bacterium]
MTPDQISDIWNLISHAIHETYPIAADCRLPRRDGTAFRHFPKSCSIFPMCLILRNDINGAQLHRRLRTIFAQFNRAYHLDFACFRKTVEQLQTDWLGNDPDAVNVAAAVIGRHLWSVLRCWQLGRNRGRGLRNPDELVQCLQDADFRNLARELANMTIENLQPDNTTSILQVIRKLSVSIHGDNGTLVYPTKALMLLWPHLPAFDSRVRNGLAKIPGRSSLRESVNWNNPNGSRAINKLTMTISVLGNFWHDHHDQLLNALAQTDHQPFHEWWDAFPGRVLDMFFFHADAAALTHWQNCDILEHARA